MMGMIHVTHNPHATLILDFFERDKGRPLPAPLFADEALRREK